MQTNLSTLKSKDDSNVHFVEGDADVKDILSPPRIARIAGATKSKKRQHKTSVQFKKENAQSKAKRRKEKKEELSKQQPITSFYKKKVQFISVSKISLPMMDHRYDFIDSLPKKDMLAHVGKSLKNNFTTSYKKKTNRRSKRVKTDDDKQETNENTDNPSTAPIVWCTVDFPPPVPCTRSVACGL